MSGFEMSCKSLSEASALPASLRSVLVKVAYTIFDWAHGIDGDATTVTDSGRHRGKGTDMLAALTPVAAAVGAAQQGNFTADWTIARTAYRNRSAFSTWLNETTGHLWTRAEPSYKTAIGAPRTKQPKPLAFRTRHWH
eukprot:COSAG03_NODE_5823_length_1167_cov_1.642322_1_plen_138_part_00